MPYNQRDLVTLKDPITLPDGLELPHPVLIISSNKSNSYEKRYTGVMMSTTRHKDRFSFPCFNEMFEGPVKDGSCFRMYLTIGFNEADIFKFINRMKPVHFRQLITELKDNLFNVD